MKKEHVYQFALRRADDDKQNFVIERDTVYTSEKITQEIADDIAKEHKCDVQITYLGVLTSKKEDVIDAKYHTQDMIQEKIIEWNKETPQEELDHAESI